MFKIIVLFSAIVILYCAEISAQPQYQMSVANVERVSNTVYEFDVFIKSVNQNFHLTSYQCALSFSQSVINNGSLNFIYLQGTSELLYLPPLTAVGLISTYGSYVLTFASFAESELITQSQKKVGRFRLTNTVPFTNNEINIRWRFIGLINTILTGSTFQDITNPDNHLNLSNPTSFSLTVPVYDGWNLVSIPGLHPINQSINTWWINRDPNAGVYAINGGFQSVNTVEPGTGYWLKNIGYTIYNTGDEWPSEGIQYITNQPISVFQGWNLIGTYDYTVNTASITTTPAGLQSGFVYSYNSGYRIANTLVPGYGYFIYLSSGGLVNLPDPAFQKSGIVNNNIKSDWGKIVITDNSGKSSELYLAPQNTDVSKYFMPPVPFEGMYDIRFSNGGFVESLNSEFHKIQLSGVEFPLTVSVSNIEINIFDEAKGNIYSRLSSGDEIRIVNATSTLTVSLNTIPGDYRLEQNFPNPFNPVTQIKFSVPEDGMVKVKVFNLLGQEINTLFNEEALKGVYVINWNGTDYLGQNVSSGVYIYRMEAGQFIKSMKMVLLK
ncbi:MAG: T9SS type A sorting domain-containing protein [Ignavibacteriales bacterium]|nr:MAG: T9SS type A sorting domain-containing protein [Ignavibacteriales bacterium]